MTRNVASLAALLLAFRLAPALAAQEAKLAGHWEGSIVLVAAEQEVDMVIDFRPEGSRVSGKLLFPFTEDGAHAVEELAVQGSHVVFSVRDKDGIVSAFDGALSPDGATLSGMMREKGRPVPFALQRGKARPVRESRSYRLAGDAIQLKAAFSGDADKTRILLLLNLGSFSSKMALRIVERYVMDRISDPNLRAYVVWTAPDVPEVATVLKQGTALATDPRITHFWSTDRGLSAVFEPMLPAHRMVPNTCLLFAPGSTWTAAAPVPDRVLQSPRFGAQTAPAAAQRLNGNALAADAQLLLQSRAVGRPAGVTGAGGSQ